MNKYDTRTDIEYHNTRKKVRNIENDVITIRKNIASDIVNPVGRNPIRMQ